jgi:hypothetical protein
MVARARRPRFRDLKGMGGIEPDYDPKNPGARGDEVGSNRAEEPRAPYHVKPAVARKKQPGRAR